MKTTFQLFAEANNGLEDPEAKHFHTYVFPSGTHAELVLRALGATESIPDLLRSRQCILRPAKNDSVCAEIAWAPGDIEPTRWLLKRKVWFRHFNCSPDQRPILEQMEVIDQHLRCVVSDTGNGSTLVGKYFRDDDNKWQECNDSHLLKCVLKAKKIPTAEIDLWLGKATTCAWRLVHIPFGTEFPSGGRFWNRNAPQLKYAPIPGNHATWNKVLRHCFADLDDVLKEDAWAQRSGITSGLQFGLAWCAFMVQQPSIKLPYLFMYGEQNSGKSIFGEALSLLLTSGVASADRALLSDFNGELEGAVLALVEETDISKSPGSYNRLKDWVTGDTLWIRRLYADRYASKNHLHFVQTANEKTACPVIFGDSRVVVVNVDNLKPGQEIPKTTLLAQLKAEAPHFIHSLLNFPLPSISGRLGLPPIATSSKERLAIESLPEIAIAISESMADRRKWTGPVKKLGELLGPGNWPKDSRKVFSLLSGPGESYLRANSISVTPGRRSEHGREIVVVKS